MDIQIFLHDGTTIEANIKGYNAAELAAQLNDQRLLVISMGDYIINKNMLKMIAPAATK